MGPHMMGSWGTGLWMLLSWLIGLIVLFGIVYGAVYLAVRRALGEMRPGMPAQTGGQPMPRPSPPPQAEEP